MPRARREGPLPRVILCATLTFDGKLLDPGGVESLSRWEAQRSRSAAVLLGDPIVAAQVQAPVMTLTAGPADQLAASLRRRRREDGTRNLICLGGAELFRALLEARLVSELWLAVQPLVEARRDASTLSGSPGAGFFPASIACRLLKMDMRDGQCLLRYRVLKIPPAQQVKS